MTFLPKDYKSPSAANSYLKLQEGENRIRIMSAPIFGWEDWDENNRPVRYAFDQKPAKPINKDKPIRHFWAFIVFNYNEEQIQIMQITQTTIRKSLEALCRDQDWGDPYNYDIKITKSGKGVDTEYTVNPVPHKPIDQYLVAMFEDKPIRLDALFTNDDPFANWDTRTPLAGDVKIVQSDTSNEYISELELLELGKIIDECDPAKKPLMWEYIDGKCPNGDRNYLKKDMYPNIKRLMLERRSEYQYKKIEEKQQNEETPF